MDELDAAALGLMRRLAEQHCAARIGHWARDAADAPEGDSREYALDQVAHWRELRRRIPALAEAVRRAGVGVDTKGVVEA